MHPSDSGLVLQPLFLADIALAAPLEIGDTPAGRRRTIGITGGSFVGERLKGRILPGGADWQLIRADGVAWLDARYTMETEDGALIHVENRGYRHGPPDVLRRLALGEPVDPGSYYMRTTPWFDTGDARYAWLNRIVCVATGARHAGNVALHVFEVR